MVISRDDLPLVRMVDALVTRLCTGHYPLTEYERQLVEEFTEWRLTLVTIERHGESISVPIEPPDVMPPTATKG